MIFWAVCAAAWTIAYLLGSLPAGYLAGRILKGIDIREHGSKSTGATNVLRVLGPWPALAVFLIDVLKGAAAVVVTQWLAGSPLAATPAGNDPEWIPWVVAVGGLAALLGHSCSIWLNFGGGKSVATGLGVLLAMAWPVALAGLGVFAVMLGLFRIVSLGSILAAAMAIVLICWMEQPWAYRVLVIAGGVYVIARHRANIGRLLNGTEPRLGQPGPLAKAE